MSWGTPRPVKAPQLLFLPGRSVLDVPAVFLDREATLCRMPSGEVRLTIAREKGEDLSDESFIPKRGRWEKYLGVQADQRPDAERYAELDDAVRIIAPPGHNLNFGIIKTDAGDWSLTSGSNIRDQFCWAHLLRDFQAMIDRGPAAAEVGGVARSERSKRSSRMVHAPPLAVSLTATPRVRHALPVGQGPSAQLFPLVSTSCPSSSLGTHSPPRSAWQRVAPHQRSCRSSPVGKRSFPASGFPSWSLGTRGKRS